MLSCEDYDYGQNREIQKSLEAKRTNQHWGIGWNIGFYVAISRMAFDLSSYKQSK